MSIDFKALAVTINDIEFDHDFTLHPDGTITDPARGTVWAPDVYNDPDGDISIDSAWSAMTGLTGQDSYHGAVMHSSEFIGAGVARAMLELVEWREEPLTFAVTVVYDLDDDTDDNAIGWAIVYTNQR